MKYAVVLGSAGAALLGSSLYCLTKYGTTTEGTTAGLFSFFIGFPLAIGGIIRAREIWLKEDFKSKYHQSELSDFDI